MQKKRIFYKEKDIVLKKGTQRVKGESLSGSPLLSFICMELIKKKNYDSRENYYNA